MVARRSKSRTKRLEKSTSSLTKSKLYSARGCSIPEEKFNEAMEALQKDVEFPNFAETKCSSYIHKVSTHTRQNRLKYTFKLLEEARLSLMQRDWTNLARVLTMVKTYDAEQHVLTFHVFVQYAVICLAHNKDEKLLDLLMHGIASCSDDNEKEKFIQSFTS